MKIKNFTLLNLLTIGSLFAVGPDDISPITPCKITELESNTAHLYLIRFMGIEAILERPEPLGQEVNTNSRLRNLSDMGFVLGGLLLASGEIAYMSGQDNEPRLSIGVFKLLAALIKSYRENDLTLDSVINLLNVGLFLIGTTDIVTNRIFEDMFPDYNPTMTPEEFRIFCAREIREGARPIIHQMAAILREAGFGELFS